MSNLQRMTAGKLRSPGWRDRPPPRRAGTLGWAVHGRARARPSGHARIAHPPRPPRRWRAPRRRRRARRAGVAPAHGAGAGRRPPTARRPGLTEAGYWAFVDPIAERMDHLWDAATAATASGGGRVGDQRRTADDPRGGRAARSPRRRPRGRPRPRAGRPDVRVAAVERARPRHAARQDVPRRRLAVQRALGRRGDGEVGRPQGRRGAGLRVARARRARGSRPPRRSAWPRSCSAVAHGAFFRYPNVRLNQINWNAEVFAHAATMTGDTSLLRRDYYLHMRRFVAGVHRPWLADHHARPCYGGSTNLGPGYRFNYLTTRPPRRRLQPRLRRVREHHRALPALVRAGARRGHAGAAARRPRRAAGLGRARAARLLDPQRLSQLGLGLGLKRWQIGKTFAFAQQGLLAIARADDFHARPEFGRVGEVLLRSRPGALHALGRRGGRRDARARLAERRPAEVGGGDGEQDPLRRAHGGQRRARHRPRARRASRAAAAAGLRLRPRHRAPGRLDAALLDGGRWPPTTAPSATAASSSPGSTTPTGGRWRRSAAGRPRHSASSCATSPTARCWPRRPAACSRASADPPAAPDARAARHRARGRASAPRVRRAVPAPRRPRRRGGRRRPRRHRAPLPCRVRRDRVDRDVGRARAPQRRRALPRVDGRGADRRRPARRHPVDARPRRDLARAGGLVSPARRAQRLRGGRGRPDRHARHRAHAGHRAAALRAAPGSTLALRLVRAARFRRRTLTARIAPARDADEAARVAAALGAR